MGVDEHVMIALAGLTWLLTRRSNEAARRFCDHLLVCSFATAVLPHAMKAAIDQERPDRLTLEGHLRGVPLSGKSTDAFPSGYALHIGALASAATLLAKVRNAIWAGRARPLLAPASFCSPIGLQTSWSASCLAPLSNVR